MPDHLCAPFNNAHRREFTFDSAISAGGIVRLKEESFMPKSPIAVGVEKSTPAPKLSSVRNRTSGEVWAAQEGTFMKNDNIASAADAGPLLQRNMESRRTVLKWSGAGLAAAIAIGLKLPGFGITEAFAAEGVDLGSGDTAVLNYAYALEQLEAAFYTQVVASAYSGITSDETTILTEIRDHEVEHREFLKKALAADAIPDLEVDFSKIDFSSRKSVLGTAKVFEDLGVSAYNGAGRLIKNGDYLLAAGKIVSVEARHAAVIRDLLQPNSAAFAGDDVVDKKGLDGALAPAKVLPKAGPFVKTKINAHGLV